MLTLYPNIKPYKRHQLQVSPLHKLYIEEVGNPDGIPVVILHGGPGAGCHSEHRRFFDPEIYRIVLFDQRGCGRSTPHACIEDNTTADSLSDIEAIRAHLDIGEWLVFGGSWGATLGLLYAQAYPKHVKGMIIRGVFLGRKHELKWLYTMGSNQIYPDYWEDFIRPIPAPKRRNMIQAYQELLECPNELARSSAARAWALWETRCGNFHPSEDSQKKASELHFALSLARISCHYFLNDCFMKENQILKNTKTLKGIPGIIVHGRYDMVCPMENAWALHNKWSDSELSIVRDAGHAASEPGIVDALVRATRRMARRFHEEPEELS